MKLDRPFTNVILSAVAFMLIFSAFQTMVNIEVKIDLFFIIFYVDASFHIIIISALIITYYVDYQIVIKIEADIEDLGQITTTKNCNSTVNAYLIIAILLSTTTQFSQY